jgi:hypothetical protein
MPKKKSKQHKHKRKSHHHSHLFGHEPTGHHARLRKHHHAAGGHHAGGGDPAGGHHRKAHKKTSKRSAKAHKPSALMKRLRAAEVVARQQLRSFGRRPKHHAEQPVTEQTLRDHTALKRVRSCSHR